MLDRTVGHLVAAASVLVLPVSLLLFCGGRYANGCRRIRVRPTIQHEVLFALYVSVAITAATRHNAFIAADAFARRYHDAVRYWLTRSSAQCWC